MALTNLNSPQHEIEAEIRRAEGFLLGLIEQHIGADEAKKVQDKLLSPEAVPMPPSTDEELYLGFKFLHFKIHDVKGLIQEGNPMAPIAFVILNAMAKELVTKAKAEYERARLFAQLVEPRVPPSVN